MTAGAPFLGRPDRGQGRAGQRAGACGREPGVDAYAWPHNETSTGVMTPVAAAGRRRRRRAACSSTRPPAPAGCRSTSAEADVYYFAPQKMLRLRRRAVDRRWSRRPRSTGSPRSPAATGGSRRSLDLPTALDNSDQGPDATTPRRWRRCSCWPTSSSGSTARAAWTGRSSRTADSSSRLYTWAEKSPYATPFVADPALRSQVVGTIDFDDSVDAAAVAKVLRANGIVDTEPYRKLGRNQLRIGDVPGGRAGRRRGADRLHRLRGGEARLVAVRSAAACVSRPGDTRMGL